MKVPVKPDFKVERDLEKKGFSLVCGIDEAGRGAWAGPLVSAAVILDKKNIVDGIDDSKRLNVKTRASLAKIIKETCVSYGVGISTVQEINKFGIQAATYLSYERAILQLNPPPDFMLIDHYRLPKIRTPQLPISHGDRISVSISAASIIAKTTRDEIMQALASSYHEAYGFEKNFGYGTKVHQDAIIKIGICENHRIKFVSNLFLKNNQGDLFDNISKTVIY